MSIGVHSNSSTCLQLYPPRDWLAGSSLPRQFDAEAISGLIEQLKPERVRCLF